MDAGTTGQAGEASNGESNGWSRAAEKQKMEVGFGGSINRSPRWGLLSAEYEPEAVIARG